MLARTLAAWLTLVLGCGEAAVDPGDVRVAQIATTTAQEGWAINYPKQRKIFFALGRLWIFFADGTDTLVTTTEDGAAFSAPSLVRSGMVFGHRCAFVLDRLAFHYACSAALPGSDVYYRRGTPSPDGTIAWEDEQIAFDVPDGQSVLYPKVVLDGLGHPWVAFMLFEGGFETPPESAIVTRSARTDAIWETQEGFPFTLVSRSSQAFPDPLGVRLGVDGTYWIYDLDGADLYRGRAWRDGAGWQPEEVFGLDAERYGLFSAVSTGSEIDVAFGGGVVRHRHRSPEGSWGPATVLSGQASGHTAVSALDDGRVRVTWLDHAAQRVVSRVVGPHGAEPAELLLDAAREGGLSGSTWINLNGIEAPAAPFQEAVAVSVGQGPEYRVLLLSR